MELYLKVAFAIIVLRIVLRLVAISSVTYPRTLKFNAIDDVLSLVVLSGFAIWSGSLIFLK